MRRIAKRSAVSRDPREFVLAALLYTIAIGAIAAMGVTALSGGTYEASELRGFDIAYDIVGYGKYLVAARLLWIGRRTTLFRQMGGWRRLALLWGPCALFCIYAYLQWMVMGDARIHYLQRTGRWQGGFSGGVLVMMLVFPVAVALTAANALSVQRRQLRAT